MERVRKVFKNILEVVKKPEMRVLPGQLAFFFVLSLIPLIALIGAIASTFSISIETLEETFLSAIPGGVADILLSVVSGKGLSFNIVVFFISAFILASNGPHSMIITSNEIYKIKSRDVVSRRLKAIIMTFILVCLLTFLLIGPVFGNTIFEMLKEYSNNTTIEMVYIIFKVLKYPLSIIMVYINIKLLYVIAPDKKIETTTTTQGAIFTTISWILATEIYSVYVGKFSRYDIFYGSISNILILLLWVYILSYIFVLGMAFNAGNTLDIRKDKQLITKK